MLEGGVITFLGGMLVRTGKSGSRICYACIMNDSDNDSDKQSATCTTTMLELPTMEEILEAGTKETTKSDDILFNILPGSCSAV